ncbi:MAG: galactokinase family protein [Thermoproteota archaeon]
MKSKRKVIALIPAAGIGARMTPEWNINNIEKEYFPKPLVKEFTTNKSLLELVIENLRKARIFDEIYVRVGMKSLLREDSKEPGVKREAIKKLVKFIEEKKLAKIYFNNLDEKDDGTGSTILSEDIKEKVREDSSIEDILIISSDLPAIKPETIRKIIQVHRAQKNDITLVSTIEENILGHGRIVRYPVILKGIKEKYDELSKKSKKLNNLIKEGKMKVIRVAEGKEPYWVNFLTLFENEIKKLKKGEKVVKYHPIRGIIEGDKIEVDKNLVKRIEVKPSSGEFLEFDERSLEFLGVVEQEQIGVDEEEIKKRTIKLSGFEYELSASYINSIKERNVLCMVVSREVLLNTIRDIDAKSEIEKKIVLRKHKEEYFLPEVANEAVKIGKKVGVVRIKEREAIGVDTRTDLRMLSIQLKPRKVAINKEILRRVKEDKLVEAKENELQVLEQVFGVNIYPGTKIFFDKQIKSLLESIEFYLKKEGSTKRFFEKYGSSLREQRYEKFGIKEKFTFRVGVNSSFLGVVALSGNIDIKSFCKIENCYLRNVEIGENACVNSSILENCLVEGSYEKVVKISNEREREQILGEDVNEETVNLEAKPIKVSKAIEELERRKNKELEKIYGSKEVASERKEKILKTLKKFMEIFGDEEVIVVRVPGRLNLMGRHIDHRGGSVNVVAIPREIIAVVSKRNDGMINLFNADEQYRPFFFSITEELPPARIKDYEWRIWTQDRVKGKIIEWYDYARSVVFFQNMYRFSDGSFIRKFNGANIVVLGDIPQSAGLSSSSALVVAINLGIVVLNKLRISKRRFVEWCGMAEWIVGTRGGYGDHAAMMFSRVGKIANITTMPLKVRYVSFPRELLIAVCDSLVKARKSRESKSKFNEKVATYEIALLLFKKKFPEYGKRVKIFRDLIPENMGVKLEDYYEILKEIPEAISRNEVMSNLSENAEFLSTLFKEHEEPKEGYKVRGVMLFGVSEIERAKIAPLMISKDPARFGTMMNISHNADREYKYVEGEKVKWINDCSNEYLDNLIRKLKEKQNEESCQLYMQSGDYGCGHEKTDLIVDLATSVNGVLGAEIVGAGLGGSVAILLKKEALSSLTKKLYEEYYKDETLARTSIIAFKPIEGATLIHFTT